MLRFKNGLYLFMLVLLIMITINIFSLNIPTDQTLYRQTKSYFTQTGKLYGLSAFKANDIGLGMINRHNSLTLFKDVQPAYNVIISEMEKARRNINIELFIIRNDATGRYFKNVLIKKARQGVEVRLLYDAWGSGLTSRAYFNDLKKNGVKAEAFNPLWSGFWQGRLTNRLHRKMIIIDGNKAFIGGENIGDEYLGKKKKIGFWKDTGIIFHGDAACSIQQIFLYDWLQSSHKKELSKDYYPNNTVSDQNTVKIIPGGPDSPQTSMSLPYISLINQASQKICIVSPYLSPDTDLLTALYKAADRKVEIQLILPSKVNHKIASFTNTYYADKLLKHGIKVYAYNKGFIHSKYIIVDDRIASVGTANLDRLSLFRNYEVNSVFYNKDIIKQLQEDFAVNLNNSHAVHGK